MNIVLGKKQTLRIAIGATIALVSIVIIAFAALTVRQPASAFTGAGSGSISDPFLVTTCEQLQSIHDDAVDNETYGKLYMLANNVDCSATSTWNSGAGFIPIGFGGYSFSGVFDGAGFTISGLTINRPSSSSVGLFSNISNDGVVGDFFLTGLSVTGQSNVGSIAGYVSGVVIAVDASGSVTGASSGASFGVGGAIGRLQNNNSNDPVSRVIFRGTVTNTGDGTGGLIGSGGNGRIVDSYSDAVVSGARYVGGITGNLNGCCGYVERSYAVGSVTGTQYVGGLVGAYDNTGDQAIRDSFSAAAVSGTSQVGAVIGSIRNSYGAVTVENLHFDQTAAGTATCVASTDRTVNCTAQNTDGLSADYFYESTNTPLSGWDFTNVWVEQASDYPTHRDLSPLAFSGGVQSLNVEEGSSVQYLSVTWTAPLSSGTFPVSSYQIEAKLAGDTWSNIVASAYAGPSGTSATLENVAASTEYDVRVAPRTALGLGAWTEFSFTTAAPSVVDVETCAELATLDDTIDAYDTIRLMNDIDCTGLTVEPLGYSSNWFNDRFRGTFNGQNNTISNLNVYYDSSQTALFTEIEGGTVENVIFDAPYIEGFGGDAVVAYRMTGGVLRNIDVRNAVVDSTYNTGGVVANLRVSGQGQTIEVTDVSFDGSIITESDSGGLFGRVVCENGSSISISRSRASADIEVVSDYLYGGTVGGLIGQLYAVTYDNESCPITIEDVYASGDVTGFNYSAGGLIGSVESSSYSATGNADIIIQRAYAAGNVTSPAASLDFDEDGPTSGGSLIGRLSVRNDPASSVVIQDSFGAGLVNIPGAPRALIGDYFEEYPATLTNIFYDRSGIDRCVGLGETDVTCSNVDESASPFAFRDAANAPLSSWDFDAIWQETSAYPLFIGESVVDQDGDGVADVLEKSAPNAGDVNGDGVRDDTQPHVLALVNEVTSEYAALEVDPTCEIRSLGVQPASDLSVQDAAYAYAIGFMNFTIDCDTAGATTQVKQYYFNESDQTLSVRKFNPTTNAYFTVTGATLAIDEIGGIEVLVANYAVTDGGILDLDGTVNATIVDPVGLGQVEVSAPNTGIGGRHVIANPFLI